MSCSWLYNLHYVVLSKNKMKENKNTFKPFAAKQLSSLQKDTLASRSKCNVNAPLPFTPHIFHGVFQGT